MLSELIKQGLAVNLMAGADNKLQDQIAGFYIDITLTEKGMIEENMWKTINLAFAAINKFREEGIKDYYIRERRIVGDLQFQFYQPQSAKITSQLLASKLDLWDEENMKCSPNDLIYRQYCCKLDGQEEIVK